MKKLMLEIEDLAVETFEPTARLHWAGTGTVHGRETSYEEGCPDSDDCVTTTENTRADCTDAMSCYEPQCADTGMQHCTAGGGLCSVDYCWSVGEC